MLLIFAAAAVGLARPAPARNLAPITGEGNPYAMPRAYEGVGVDEKPGAAVDQSLVFKDESGRTVLLREYLSRGRPVVLQMAYYECPKLCDMIAQGLVNSLRNIDLSIGLDFDVLCVSFDPKETPAQAAAKKRVFVSQYDRPGASAGWTFLVGDEEPIAKLTDSIGFRYKYLPQDRAYSHPAVLMVLTPDGRVARYLYGAEIPPAQLKGAIVDARAGLIRSETSDVSLPPCAPLSEGGNRLVALARDIMKVAGGLFVIVAGTWIWRSIRREAARRRAQEGETAEPATLGGFPVVRR